MILVYPTHAGEGFPPYGAQLWVGGMYVQTFDLDVPTLQEAIDLAKERFPGLHVEVRNR